MVNGPLVDGNGAPEKKPRLYQVDRFKRVIEAQESTRPLTGFRLVMIRLRNGVDSVGGLVSTFLVVATFFAAPFVVVMGVVYRWPGFLASFTAVIGVFSLYVKHRLGSSMQFVETSWGRKLLGQLVGCALVVVAFYVVFVILLGIKLS